MFNLFQKVAQSFQLIARYTSLLFVYIISIQLTNGWLSLFGYGYVISIFYNDIVTHV